MADEEDGGKRMIQHFLGFLYISILLQAVQHNYKHFFEGFTGFFFFFTPVAFSLMTRESGLLNTAAEVSR